MFQVSIDISSCSCMYATRSYSTSTKADDVRNYDYSFTRSGGFWHQLRDSLNPAWPAAPGAKPWLYYGANALFIFIFNVLDIVCGYS